MKYLKLFENFDIDIDFDNDFDFEEEEQFDNLDIKDYTLKYGKLTMLSIMKLKNMDVSYKQLVDSGIWDKVKLRDRIKVLDILDSKFNVGDKVICWDDKRRLGSKPLITEGKTYEIQRVRGRTIYIENDGGKTYWYDCYRFCWK